MQYFNLLVTTLFLIVDRVFTQVSTGPGTFQVISANNKSIDVATFVPNGVTTSSQFVLAMHGLGDNGNGMRDSWISLANKYKYVILAPNFNDNWSGNYQLAGLDGPRSDWEIDVLDRVFDEAKKRYNST
uniref:Feruloyl esterase n=1 Tax=Panagrolaimus sp. ES5 TaxID=591445 RepID=A0AC34GA63_9BILA